MKTVEPPELVDSHVSEHELAVLGSLALNPPVVHEVSQFLTGADFRDDTLGKLYNALLLLHESGKPIDDYAVLKAELPKLKVPAELYQPAFIAKLLTSVPHAAHARFYADEIKRAADKRRLYNLGLQLCQQACQRELEPEEIAYQCEARLRTLKHDTERYTFTARQAAELAIAEIEAARNAPTRPGCMTGLLSYDSIFGPTMGGELHVIAARPACGKSALAAQIVFHAGERGKRGLFVSLEMTAKELVLRELCKQTGLNSRLLRMGHGSPNDLTKLHRAVSAIDHPVTLYAPPPTTLANIRAVAKHLHATAGLSVLAIDYLQLLEPMPEERQLRRHEVVARWTKGLKQLAKELEVPVFLLAQLNRETDAAEVPKLANLAESSAIEKDADIVTLIHHPTETGQPPRPNDGEEREVHLIVEKHRHNSKGVVPLLWAPAATLFGDMPEAFPA